MKKMKKKKKKKKTPLPSPWDVSVRAADRQDKAVQPIYDEYQSDRKYQGTLNDMVNKTFKMNVHYVHEYYMY